MRERERGLEGSIKSPTYKEGSSRDARKYNPMDDGVMNV